MRITLGIAALAGILLAIALVALEGFGAQTGRSHIGGKKLHLNIEMTDGITSHSVNLAAIITNWALSCKKMPG